MKREWIGKAAGVLAVAILAVVRAFTFPAAAAQGGGSLLESLKANGKIRAPQEVLADFVAGKEETAVIVLLEPSEAARNLAARSRLSFRIPPEFDAPGAPLYYDLQDDAVRTDLRATVAERVAKTIERIGSDGVTVTQRFSYQFGFAARVTPAALARIVALPEVVAVEKDHVLQPHLAQGIPLMNAATTRTTYTGAGMSIAICDTGIDTSHPRLGGGGFPNTKVIGGYDTGDNDPDPRPDSTYGNPHGTACAGIAAGGLATMGDYIGGVAPDAKLYAVKISTGTAGSAATSAMIAGWEWALTHKNDDPANPILIVSTSFGGRKFTSACDGESTAMTTAAANAVSAGITVFASSGNDGYCDSIAWPACISFVNSVGAVYDANFGSYNPCVNALSCAAKIPTVGCTTGYYVSDATAPDKVTAYSNSASFLTLFAPSNRVYTTDIVGAGGYGQGDYYTSFGGTSAACPYAAGTAALLQQAAKVLTGSYLTPARVRSYLVNNGDNVTDGKVAVTKPRINAGRAIAALPGISAPILAGEPSETPGTENTIFWDAVASGAAMQAGTTAAGMIRTSANGSNSSADMPTTPAITVASDGSIEPAHAVYRPASSGAVVPDVAPAAPDPVPLETTTIVGETFEGDFPGSSWEVRSNIVGSPMWGGTWYDQHLGARSAWCAGSSTISPAGGYANKMDSWMIYGPFSLADATSADMTFWYRNFSENNYDYFRWLASVNGTSFYGYQVTGNQNSWRSQTFDLKTVPILGNLSGQPHVWVAFNFVSDSSATYAGTFVDDIVISKQTAVAQPNLTSYQPAGWSDRIVVSKVAGTFTGSGSLTTEDSLFVAWAAINNGSAPAAAGFYSELYVDDVLTYTFFTDPPLNPGGYSYQQDYSLGKLPAGTHSIRIRLDSTNVIAESRENDNEYTKQITVTAAVVTEYYAECSDSSAFTSPVSSGWTRQTHWTFRNLTPGTTYWYRVKARRNETESAWSSVEHSRQQSPGTTLQFSSSAYAITENGGSVTITATRLGSFANGVGVSYATVDGTATGGSDYTAKSGTLFWASGDSADKTFSVPVTNDALTESNENFLVNLSAPTGGAMLGSPVSATVTVVETAGCTRPPIMIPARALTFSALQDAFDAVESGDSLLFQSINFVGDVLHWKNVPAATAGGYDCGCATRCGSFTTVSGSMTIGAGALILDGIVLK